MTSRRGEQSEAYLSDRHARRREINTLSHHDDDGDDKSGGSGGGNSSFFWRINSVPTSYMFGTIHVPYTRVWDAIPLNAKQAFLVSKVNNPQIENDNETVRFPRSSNPTTSTSSWT